MRKAAIYLLITLSVVFSSLALARFPECGCCGEHRSDDCKMNQALTQVYNTLRQALSHYRFSQGNSQGTQTEAADNNTLDQASSVEVDGAAGQPIQQQELGEVTVGLQPAPPRNNELFDFLQRTHHSGSNEASGGAENVHGGDISPGAKVSQLFPLFGSEMGGALSSGPPDLLPQAVQPNPQNQAALEPDPRSETINDHIAWLFGVLGQVPTFQLDEQRVHTAMDWALILSNSLIAMGVEQNHWYTSFYAGVLLYYLVQMPASEADAFNTYLQQEAASSSGGSLRDCLLRDLLSSVLRPLSQRINEQRGIELPESTLHVNPEEYNGMLSEVDRCLQPSDSQRTQGFSWVCVVVDLPHSSAALEGAVASSEHSEHTSPAFLVVYETTRVQYTFVELTPGRRMGIRTSSYGVINALQSAAGIRRQLSQSGDGRNRNSRSRYSDVSGFSNRDLLVLSSMGISGLGAIYEMLQNRPRRAAMWALSCVFLFTANRWSKDW